MEDTTQSPTRTEQAAGSTAPPANPTSPAPVSDPQPTAEELARQAAAERLDKARRDAREAATLLGFSAAETDLSSDADVTRWHDTGRELDQIRGLSEVARTPTRRPRGSFAISCAAAAHLTVASGRTLHWSRSCPILAMLPFTLW